jgi:HAE1 family hydrophobic/amphiphilic exporter-1
LTGCSINLYSMMGVILLMGIAKKNSIMLVEFANHLREQDGLGVQEAILQACPIRLRPILMTSLATLTAALPTALGHGAGSEARAPMAITILGGVLVSTFFTLYVVPCAYIAFSRWERPAQPEEEDDHAPNHVWSDPSGAPTESTVKH